MMRSLILSSILLFTVRIVQGSEICHEGSVCFEDLGRLQIWILSLLASGLIGLTGIIPLILIPIETGLKLNQDQGGSKYLRLLLSFAVGGLLGDVFLHLLPEAWNLIENLGPETNSNHMTLGLWVLLGMFSFVILEIMFTPPSAKKEKVIDELPNTNSTSRYYDKDCSTMKSPGVTNGHVISNGNGKGFQNGHLKTQSQIAECRQCEVQDTSDVQVAGYLNLMANSIDNFTHGLAVAGSFLVGFKMGIITTFTILIHEIPHEIGDFAILLKSGFHPRTAAKAQLSTATIGVLGVIVALSADSVECLGGCTAWILPFTAGGFLNIALVNVLPDLLNEKDPWESMKQLGCIWAGIGVMAFVSSFV